MATETVRIASIADEDEIMQLLSIMHAEGGILPLDEMEARKTFNLAFARQGGILGVIGEPGDIKAMIFLLISKFWYTRNHHLEELFNFVRPDVRVTKQYYGTRLIEFAKECAVEIGLPLTIGILTNQRMAGKVRLYRRVLGEPAGAWFVANSKWNNEGNPDFWREPFPKRGKTAKKEPRLRAVGSG